eukprot:6175342-Pleurochrysis_carterae.AAC.8
MEQRATEAEGARAGEAEGHATAEGGVGVLQKPQAHARLSQQGPLPLSQLWSLRFVFVHVLAVAHE